MPVVSKRRPITSLSGREVTDYDGPVATTVWTYDCIKCPHTPPTFATERLARLAFDRHRRRHIEGIL